MSKTSAEVKNRYNAKAYDKIHLVVKKGERDKIKAHAEKAKLSLNKFVVTAIYEKMGEEMP